MIAWGDCTQHLQAWAQTLHPTLKLDSEHAACKVNSADASLVLATLPMKVDVDEDGQGKFGVRISHCGSSRVNPYNNQALSLYVKEASQLRQIMGHLVVAESHGEWDGLCAGDFSETTRTLAIGKSGKDGFASLRVTEVSSARQRVLKGDDDCQDIRGEPRTTLFSLDYDGRRYEVPKGLVYQ